MWENWPSWEICPIAEKSMSGSADPGHFQHGRNLRTSTSQMDEWIGTGNVVRVQVNMNMKSCLIFQFYSRCCFGWGMIRYSPVAIQEAIDDGYPLDLRNDYGYSLLTKAASVGYTEVLKVRGHETHLLFWFQFHTIYEALQFGSFCHNYQASKNVEINRKCILHLLGNLNSSGIVGRK